MKIKGQCTIFSMIISLEVLEFMRRKEKERANKDFYYEYGLIDNI